MSYTSGSALPAIIGWPAVVLGSVSVLSAMTGQPIIDTPASAGFDMMASIGLAGFGYLIAKSGSKLTAILGGALLASLLIYSGLNIHMRQAVNTTLAIGEGIGNAVKAASQTVDLRENNSTTPSPTYRLLTADEKQWCQSNPARSAMANCKRGACPIAECGVRGK